MEKEENILGYEKIGKLIRKFSIPAIISMLVNSLYNIVDQIFVGRGVGYLGNGATSIIFPFVMLALAISLMVGDGSSALLSLRLGEKKEKEASKAVGNGIIIGVILTIILTAISLIFLPKLIFVFGCTEAIRPYALDYGYIIILGFPFMTIGTVLNSLIRADGKPKFAMATMVSGAILNTILDPILIFIFGMGIKGAAIATIFSQFITAILNITYIRKFKSVSLDKSCFKLELKTITTILRLGISSFINQFSIVLLVSVENNLLNKYGALSKYGSDIPITVLGIVMKISQILNSIILGLAIGSQPIIGFNYGAKNYERVKKTFNYVYRFGLIVSAVAFILFQAIPDKLIAIFGKGDLLYTEFACLAFRRYLLLVIVNGVQIPSGIFFQAIGKSSKSAIISLSRQLLILIPSMFIFGMIGGIEGLLYSGPFADGLAFIISTILLVREYKNLGRKSEELDTEKDLIENIDHVKEQIGKKFVITISREYGSGGRYIGKLLAEKLGVNIYDKEFVDMIAKRTGLSQEFIKETEDKRSNLDFGNGIGEIRDNNDELFVEESKLINELAEKESCIIVGRCSDYVLKNNKNAIRIFIYSSMENKIKRVTAYYKIKEKDAEKEIKRINKLRANHYKYYTNGEWGKAENYDLYINSDFLGVEKTVDYLYGLIKEKI